MTPQHLKLGVTDALNALLDPIRQEFAITPEFQQAFELAYPKPGKKVKKVRDKGSKHPGNNPRVKSAEQGTNVHPPDGGEGDSVRAVSRQVVETKVRQV